MNYVYSTLTNSNIFAVYKKSENAQAQHQILKRVTINGGHGMKNPRGLDTPRGVVTMVSDEDLAILQSDISFQAQVKAGFLVVDKKEVAASKKAKDMAQKDGSAPLVPKDFDVTDSGTNESPVFKKRAVGIL